MSQSGDQATPAFMSVMSGSVFAAEWNEKNRILTLHSCGPDRQGAFAGLSEALSNSGKRLVLRTHRRNALFAPRSLEELGRIANADAIIYDPTLIFSRASLMVRMVKAWRVEFRKEVAGYYFDTSSRTMLAVARNGIAADRLNVVQRRMSAQIENGDHPSLGKDVASIPVRVVLRLPRFARCVPVDKASIHRLRHWRTVLRGVVASMMSAGLFFGAAAQAKTADHEILGSLSVFAEGDSGGFADAFIASGIALFFGDTDARGQTEIQLAQGAPGDSGPGLRIVVNLERQVEDQADLRRPSWAPPFTDGAGPGS